MTAPITVWDFTKFLREHSSEEAQKYIKDNNLTSDILANKFGYTPNMLRHANVVGSDSKTVEIGPVVPLTQEQEEQKALQDYRVGVNTAPLDKDKKDINGNSPTPKYDAEGNVIGYSITNSVNGAQAVYTDYDADGNFVGSHGNTTRYQGRDYTPTYDANGALTYQPIQVNRGGNFFSDILSALGPIAPIAVAIFAPELLPSLGAMAAPAVSAGLSVLAGEDPVHALEKAGLSYVGGNIAGGVSSGLTDTLGTAGANLAGKVAASEILSGGKTDLGKLLTNTAISGGIGAATNTGPTSSDMVEGYFGPGGEGDPFANTNAGTSGSPEITSGSDQPAPDVVEQLQDAGLTNTDNSSDVVKQLIDSGLTPTEPTLTATEPPASTNPNGYYDEETGHWIDTSSGKEIDTGSSTAGPLTNENSGDPESMKDWSFDKETGKWAWTDPATGETTNYEYATPIRKKRRYPNHNQG
jgi:hypothetical protein